MPKLSLAASRESQAIRTQGIGITQPVEIIYQCRNTACRTDNGKDQSLINLHILFGLLFDTSEHNSVTYLRSASVGNKQTERCHVRITYLYAIQNMPKGIFFIGCLAPRYVLSSCHEISKSNPAQYVQLIP